jgi:antitoxin YefM
MKIYNYTEARQNFAKVLDGVTDDAEEVVIHRAGHDPVVIISLAEWNSMKETEYLLGNRANAEHLRRGIAELDGGLGLERELSDPESDQVA